MNSTTTSALDPAATPPSAVGSTATTPVENFHHYQVLRRPDGTLWELGRGAMGVTYKAFDVNLRSPVALKVVSPHALTDETARARFVREARAAARLRHRNVASVYHLGQDGQNFFYAMEFVDGETLEALVRRDGPLPANLALRLALQVARALGAAHREGLVHRDIKPANLMVVSDEDEDGGLLLKVIDFGLARTALGAVANPTSSAGASATSGLSALTHAGFVGTPLFASPEQLEEHEVDIRADIYSLGVTLWYALTGSPPFTGSLAGIISQHLTREPPWEKLDAPGHAADAAGPLRGLLARLLAKDRNDRPADPATLRRELEEALRALPLDDGDATVADLGPTRRGRERRPARLRPLPATEAPLANRYELIRPAGEGSAGRVFLARDLAPGSGGRFVALKMLHADLLVTAEDEAALADLVRRARTAAHANLLETFSVERDGGRHFVVQEWLHGFNLIALLRSRGALDAADVLHLLDGAAAAFDAARAGGLPSRRLELGLHQVVLHFPTREAGAAKPPPVPSGQLADWPVFRLKIDPLGIGREAVGGDPLLTWAGDQTLVPAPSAPPTPPRELTHDTRIGLVGENTAAGNADELDLAAGLRALGGLVYALLGGAAAAMADAGPMARYVSLPALSERANAVLRRCCLPAADGTAGFRRAREFADALRGSRPATVVAIPAPAPSSVAADEPPRLPVAPPPQPRPTRRTPTPGSAVTLAPSRVAEPVRNITRSPAVTPAPRDRDDGEAWVAASTSIAHLIDPPRSPSRSPMLAALIALTVLAVAGGWFGVRFLLPGRHDASSAPLAVGTPSPSSPRPAVTPPRKTPAVPAASRPRIDPEPVIGKSAPTPPPLARVTPATPGPEEAAPAAVAATTVPAPRRPPAEPPPAATRRETTTSPAVVRPAPHAVVTAPRPSAPGAPPAHRVRVNLSSEPSGAELTLGEQSLGVAPQTVTLLPGEYTVRARYGDWPEASRSVRVPAEGVESVDARIKLLPRAAASGAPTLNSPGGMIPTLPPAPPGEADAGSRNGSRRDPAEEDASPESQALPAIPVPPETSGDGGF